MVRLLLFIIIMGAVVGFIWHDEVSVWLDKFEGQVEEKAPVLIDEQSKNLENWWQEYGEEKVDEFVASLTEKGKNKIDFWLEEKKLNKYGDDTETVYAGGTPLFNEATGESTDRYSYLLKKFPELIDELNLGQYLNN